MKIPADILAVLTCSECEALLYRGPVFQQHDGAAVCGRCVAPERPATRNVIYEAAAKMLHFPCKNLEFGCRETVSFAEETQEIAHEQACVHRQYLCPVVPVGQCEWLGRRRDLHAHCTKEHPDKVLRNGIAQLTHDITKSSLQTYVLSVFHFLFLVHTKVCISTGKIFHAVRCLGDPSKAAKFRFTVDVKRGLQLITKSSRVAPQGCMAIQEDTAMAFNINSLLEILDGFKDTMFAVTVYDTAGCKKCSVDLSQYFYPDKNGWLCERCAPVRRACKYQDKGCKFFDIKEKCSNHESFFCSHMTQCPICNQSIAKNTLNAHYNSAHNDVTLESGTIWRIVPDWGKCYLISIMNVGIIRCRTYLNPTSSHMQLIMTCSFPSELLHEVCCEIQLTDSVTKHSKTYKPELSYSSQADWDITIQKSDFPSCSKEFDVRVSINRVEC